MLRLFFITFLFVQPFAANAMCIGVDLIKALPEDEREQIENRITATPYAQGLLWRATRDDTEITLFGTYHFRHTRTQDHLDRLTPMITAAEAVYLEMSGQDQKAFQDTIARDPSIMFITEGKTLPELLGDTDWQHFRAEMENRRIPGIMAAKFKPLWAAMMLGIGPCEARNGAMQDEGIDALIGQHAEMSGTPSRSLEDFSDVLSALDEEPLDKQLDMIRMALSWPENSDDISYTIRKRYLKQEVALIWEFSRFLTLEHGGASAEEDFARLERVLLTERNTAWVAKLMKEVPGQRVFVAVGAGHLPGENGVLQLLAEEGFEIGRIEM